MEQATVKQCRQILKKNNLHPLRRLGKGAFSMVFSVEKIELKSPENEVYSVKCIHKKQFSKKPYLVKYIHQEIASMRQLAHPHIVRLTRTFQDDGWIFILMEYCDLGNLYSAQASREHQLFQLEQAIYITRSVLRGLTHIHSQNLIHRDIKAENILLVSDTSKKEPYGYMVKICDLGFCREDDENVSTFCGTTSYMAPQIFKKQVYDGQVDVWAVGVLLFKMLFGDFPFKSINMEYEIASKCSKGFNLKKMKVKHNPSLGKDHTEALAELFSQVFRLDPQERISLTDLTQHHLFQPIKQTSLTRTCASTESQSDQEVGFQRQKSQFIEGILAEVRGLNFLSSWQQLCFEFYIHKMCLSLAGGKQDEYKKRISKKVAVLGKHIDCKIAQQQGIPRLKEYYSPIATSFQQFKEPYRLVVGHVFSKAHKAINQNIVLRSQVKMQLFCCHLINRIFEKQYRNEIFSHYFNWLKAQRLGRRFDFGSFRQWIKQQNPERLVQTVQAMNDKFYKKK